MSVHRSRNTSQYTSSTFSPENRHLSSQFDCVHRIRTHNAKQVSVRQVQAAERK